MYKSDESGRHAAAVTANIRGTDEHHTELLTDLFFNQISASDLIRIISNPHGESRPRKPKPSDQ